ncbi:carboxypeptidase-like regulatory domain-containing protein [Hymenobacter negativus]|uniref:Carboxypeptidase-like regulatory domain-containing protein n=1 Tax=Hymenobacter negativus TaxID=2795026 RepID=A0ABS0QCW2_9BACT|nr:carboxypeptidase-like regulatory domain-containing protein [Hymenobacter negativus]MBH8560163.1 carboxypeptidase-like regulatory domain-containing protein [Hymenobacter negativus]
MKSGLTSTVVAIVFLLTAMPSQAQYAYTQSGGKPEDATSTDPEEGAKTATTKVIHGVVQGRKGALPGATVWLHGTRTIVVTNSEGEFELRVPSNVKEVELTCGYGGLREEVVRLGAVQALGSVYLLREIAPAAN